MQSMRSILSSIRSLARHKSNKDGNNIPAEIATMYKKWQDYACQALEKLIQGAAELEHIEIKALVMKEKLKETNEEIDAMNNLIETLSEQSCGRSYIYESDEDEDSNDEMHENELKEFHEKLLMEKTHQQCSYLQTGLSTMNLLYVQEILSDYLKNITEEVLIFISEQPIERSKTNDVHLAKMINTIRFVHGEITRISKRAEDVRNILKTNFVGRLSDEYYNFTTKDIEESSFEIDADGVKDTKSSLSYTQDMEKQVDKCDVFKESIPEMKETDERQGNLLLYWN